MRSALAICWRISADGRRSPRSIWLRYGLEIPASSDSRRRERRAVLRCSRMKDPRSFTWVSVVLTPLRDWPPRRPGIVQMNRRNPGELAAMHDYTLPDLPYDYVVG